MKVYSPEIAKMFDTTAKTGCLDGIMGNEHCNQYEIEKIKEILESIDTKKKDRLLDAGVGVGRLIPLCKELGFKEIIGVDFSDEMIARCPKDIKTYKADLSDLFIFKDNSFDVTVLIYTLIHIVDDNLLQKAIREVERVTRNEIIIGQVFEPERVGLHGGWCKVREVYDIIKMFKKKKVEHFYKNYYEIKATDGSWINKISFLVMR